ncbi:TRAFAC clade GTPase domain-containing protein (plasmid) [Pseudoalteromonas lipolytica]|uniref:TRAFAC clade GTPase domain-containing protein n=1 Tax=Pseudoalteromonas lipolytica TaxID=570156 RepID=UPI003BA1C209
MQQCSNSNCFVHDGEACCLGELDHEQCPSWNSNKQDQKQSDELAARDISSRVSWSSSSLGSADLASIYHQSPSILIGLLGAHNTGKTTFLAANYLQLLSGKGFSSGDFCSSFTLGAWESVASWARINNDKQLPSFPPHTPRGIDRAPGVLHFGLKSDDQKVKNIFLTDAPGEWFAKWAINADSSDAEGAKWTASHSDAFLVFADSEKLSGENRSSARMELRTIIERLGEVVGSKPVTLIWAKSEHHPKEGIKRAIKRALEENVPQATEMEVSVSEPATFQIALDSLIKKAWHPLKGQNIVEPILNNTPFYAFRGHHENT